MSPRSKREYLEAILKRYCADFRIIKTAILNEFCAACGYHRKHALRLLRTFANSRKSRRPNAVENVSMMQHLPVTFNYDSKSHRDH